MQTEQRSQGTERGLAGQAAATRGWLGTPWFARRTVGWGYRPATWQGWGLSAPLALFVISASGLLRAHHAALFLTSLAVVCVVHIALAAMTSLTP
jgi:hypothetical protein